MNEEIIDPDLTPEQKELVKSLSNEQLNEIDQALLSNACKYFRKVARVVGTTMNQLPNRIEGIPDIFYAQRIKHLVSQGKLESEGNLNAMRFSEVRISGACEIA